MELKNSLKPKVRIDIQLGANLAFAMGAAFAGNVRDAIEHQHRGQRQLGVARAKYLTPATGQKLLVIVT